MPIEMLFLVAALLGTAAGGWIDLKTTEIPDIVPMSMIGIGLVLHIIDGMLAGSYQGLISGVTVCIIYLIIGYILYYTGQWGEADVLLLAATGFLIPRPLSFFNIAPIDRIYPLIFLLNIFIVGGIYSIIYSTILSLKNPAVFSNFFKDITKNKKKIIMMTLLVTSALTFLTAISLYALKLGIAAGYIAIQFALFIPLTACIILIYRFAVVLDNTAFKSRILTSRLKEGDVLAETLELKNTTLSGKLFIGLTANQINQIKKEKKYINIKEGIRYGPTFFLSILFTWFFGNSILLIFGWI